MNDYAQPDFYKFNTDSLDIRDYALKVIKKDDRVLDLGCGSGVIGLELMDKGLTCDFLEVNEKFRESLEANFKWKGVEPKVFWMNLQDFEGDTKYDLIVSNPPYFEEGSHRLSPDVDRNRSRFFLDCSFQDYLDFFKKYLSTDGVAIFSTRNNNILDFLSEFKSEILGKRDETLFVAIKLQVK